MSKQVPAVSTKLSVAVARSALLEGFRQAEGRNPTGNVLALLMAQSALETGNWQQIQNNNFGNLKTGSSWEGDWTTFPCGESGTSYPAGDPHCFFRSYPTPGAGAADYVRLLTRRAHWREGLLSGSPVEFNEALSRRDNEAGIYPYYTADPTRYGNLLLNRFERYGGLTADPKAQTDSGGSSVGEQPSGSSGSPARKPAFAEYPQGSTDLPTVRVGMVGLAVEVVQRALGAKPDGVFGPLTERAVMAKQNALNLLPDGIVGPKTWRGLVTR